MTYPRKSAILLLQPTKGTTVKIEVWDTRYGTSVRVVSRQKNGKFVSNKSDRQIVKVILDLDDKGEYDRPKKFYKARSKA